MSKNNIIWLAILSIVATFCLWLFNGSLFTGCYSIHPEFVSLHLFPQSPLGNCLIYSSLIAFTALFVAPVLITMLFYGVYVLMFNRPLPTSHYIIWFFWFVALYYLIFLVSFLPPY